MWGQVFFFVCHCDSPIGTEELAHLEMVSTIVYQLTRGLTTEQIKKAGDVLADLHEDLSAEQKARLTYDNILRYADDPDVRDPIKFLRAREIVHYQRFGEGLRIATDNLNSKNFYAFNPSFDKK